MLVSLQNTKAQRKLHFPSHHALPDDNRLPLSVACTVREAQLALTRSRAGQLLVPPFAPKLQREYNTDGYHRLTIRRTP